MVNYTKDVKSKAKVSDIEHLDVSDGGHYNTLWIESLINRGCGYIIVVDAEHDKEEKDSVKSKPFNQPGFLRNLFGKGKFSFDPQFSTAKLDYDFTEHRNLSDLGSFIVDKFQNKIIIFINESK